MLKILFSGWAFAAIATLLGCAQTPPKPAVPSLPISAPAVSLTDSWQEDLLALPNISVPAAALEESQLYHLLIAEFAGQRSVVSVAVEHYGKLIATTTNPLLAERATKIALYAQDDKAALANAEKWINLAPKNLEARQIAAAMYVRQGQATAAIAHLEYVLEHDRSKHGDKLKMIASLLGREEDKTTALQVMESVLSHRLNDPDTLLVYAVLALRADKLDASRRAMDQLVAKADVSPNMALAYVSALEKEGEIAEALAFLERALARTPGEFGLRLLYARMLAEADRFKDARLEFLKLNRQAPDSTDVIYALGLLNLQTNRVENAEQNFQDLAKYPERRDDASFYLGQIAESRKQPALALEHYRSVVSGASQFQAQVRTAVLLAGQQKVTEARAILANLKPDSDDQRKQAVLVEAEILAEQKDFANAMAVFDKALNGTYDTTLLYSRAMLAERMNRLDVLEADLRQILLKEPDNSDALNALGFTLADRTARYAEAHELIKRASALSPDNFYVLDSMGWVLYRLGRLEEAVPYLQKARAQRNDPEVAAHLGEVLWVLGRQNDAREVWNTALEAHPEDRKILDAIKRLAP
ncbi:MAG: tetratricopeptide repeat protein [Gammaproteobacteria bacterium]|nr:tetratricopeptide repeat protein [Gammaproteobacteria bacterium]